MNLHQYIFCGLRCDLPFRVDLCPIENAGVVVELAPGQKQLRFRERMFRLDRGNIHIDEPLLCAHPSQGHDLSRKYLRTFIDVVNNLDTMRIGFRDLGCSFAEA